MYISKDYFDERMTQIQKQLADIEEICMSMTIHKRSEYKKDMDGEPLLENYDLCQMLNVSKRTLQRYRSSGDLPYQMIYHKTFYRQSDVLAFIERNFERFRKMNKK